MFLAWLADPLLVRNIVLISSDPDANFSLFLLTQTILRGFYDPLESCAKRLSIRYEFRGREHYAEFGDSAPVLLPLESMPLSVARCSNDVGY